MAEEICEVRELGVQVVVVVGGGNIFRGLSGSKRGVERATGDYMGMLATHHQFAGLAGCAEKLKAPTWVQSAIAMSQPWNRSTGGAVRHRERPHRDFRRHRQIPRISRLTPPRRCGRMKSARERILKPLSGTVSAPDPKKNCRPSGSRFPTLMPCNNGWRSWIPPHFHSAWTTRCRSSCSGFFPHNLQARCGEQGEHCTG